MKRLTILAVALLLAPHQARAQETGGTRDFLPFVFAAPGGISDGSGTTLHVGGGFDRIIWKGIGAGAEIGFLGPFPSGFEYGIGVLSVNGSYQRLVPGRRVTPFVTGGYSLAFREGYGNALNFGGGVNVWLTDGVGLRLEFRDHIPIYEGNLENFHLWGARVGFTWKR